MKKFTILLALVAVCGVASAAVSWTAEDPVVSGDLEISEATANNVNGFDLTLSVDEALRSVTIEGIQADIAGSWSLSFLDAGFDTNRSEGIESGGVFYNVKGAASAAGGVIAGEIVGLKFNPDGNLTAGDQINFSFVELSAGNTVSDLESNYTALTGFSVDVVPEPMTMALLGLGGLFVRRRSA